MNTHFKQIVFTLLLLIICSCKAPGGSDTTVVHIKTTLGDIKIQLYDQTPIHRDNFIKLVNSGFGHAARFYVIVMAVIIETGITTK